MFPSQGVSNDSTPRRGRLRTHGCCQISMGQRYLRCVTILACVYVLVAEITHTAFDRPVVPLVCNYVGGLGSI